MGRYKIFANKNTGILENYPTVNTGENEVTELWYGVYGRSRFLIKFDFSDYLSEFNVGRVPHFSASTISAVTVNIFNCNPIFEDIDLALSTQRATSGDIVLHQVDTDWDEGNGHDFTGLETESDFACWYSARTTTNWISSGGDYSTEILRVSIDKGNENFSGSVSGIDLLWSTVTGTNHGYLLKFTDDLESLTTANKTISKFYTRHTNTTLAPHIEVSWDNQIRDQRSEIIPGTTKKLYLYTKHNGTFANVQDVSGVTIAFSDTGITHNGFSASAITNPMPGIYCIDFDCPSGATEGLTFTDTWQVQYELGMIYTGISQTGSIKTSSFGWETTDDIDPTEYWITIPDLEEEYRKGQRIHLDVMFRTPYTNVENVVKTADYRIWIENNNSIERHLYVNWEPVSYTENGNFVYVDTSWFQTGFTYVIDFRYETDGNLVMDINNRRRFRVS